jgi:hypothetical protein
VTFDDADTAILVLHRRARLLRDAANTLDNAWDLATVPPVSLFGELVERLRAEAAACADEAATLVMRYGADHGEAYYHEDGQLVIGWALPDEEVTR